MKKLSGVIAIVVASLAMTVPAGALAPTTHVTFRTGGGAVLHRSATNWSTTARVTGLKPGTYDYVIGVFIGKNGVPLGGISRRICRFTSTSAKNTYVCTASGRNLAPGWGAPQRPNLFTGEIDVDLGYTSYPVAGDLADFS